MTHPGAADLPLISIVVPAYNAEPYLAACVASVLAQTHARFELILVNDGSSDGTAPLAERLAAGDGRIRVIHTDNGGASRARNLGIAATTGDFIFFLDADDRIEPCALAALAGMQARTGADLVIGSYHKILDDKEAIPDDGGVFEDTLFDQASLDRYVEAFLKKPHVFTLLAHCWGRLFRAQPLRDGLLFNETLSQLEDVDLNFRYMQSFAKVAYSATRVYRHSIRRAAPTNMTARMGSEERAIDKFFVAYESVVDFLKQRQAGQGVAQMVGHLYVTTAIIALIRVVRNVRPGTVGQINKTVKSITCNPSLKENLQHYRPEKGDSKSIYLALRLGCSPLVFLFTYMRVQTIKWRRFLSWRSAR